MNCKQIYFFVGTTAELIKLFPVMQEMKKNKLNYKIIASGQNKLDRELFEKADIGQVDIHLSKEKITQTTFGLGWWFTKTLFKAVKLLKNEFNSSKGAYFIVHGDTISTVMGALIGKFYGLKIVHVEAGLRSFNYFKPFPEEIDRIVVSSLASVHCCPNEWAVDNLKTKNGIKINTCQNTLLDSLSYAISVEPQSEVFTKLEGKPFFIFVYHRQENLFNELRMRKIFEKIGRFAKRGINCLLILHSPTKEALIKYKMFENIKETDQFVLSDRLGYFEFMKVLSLARFIVTDGGSNQEEAFYLGKPCLLLRNETERKEGLNHNVILSQFEEEVITEFLENFNSYSRPAIKLDKKPSEIIVDYINKKS